MAIPLLSPTPRNNVISLGGARNSKHRVARTSQHHATKCVLDNQRRIFCPAETYFSMHIQYVVS